MNELKDFIEHNLKPAIFRVADRVFPEMDFKPYKGGWGSNKGLGGREVANSRPDKSVITKAHPFRILEQGAGSVEVIEYYQTQHNLQRPIDAIKELCKIVGIECPSGDTAEYIAYKEKQDRLQKVIERMQANLLDRSITAAHPTQDYLAKRGYDYAIMQGMGLGYCSPQDAAELKEILGGDSTYFPNGAGGTHTLSIPYLSEGNIQGIVFRAIEEGAKGKYLKVFTSRGASQKYKLFGLTGVPVTGADRSITIVEGELDALRAAQAGVPNIVAAASKELSAEALIEAKKKGIEKVVLLYDWDGADKQEERSRDIEKALGTIRSVGLTGLVAAFPQEGQKVDTDTYLKTHTGKELQQIIEDAAGGIEWQLGQIWRKYSGNLTGAQEHDFIRDTTACLFASNLSKWEQQRGIALAEKASGGRITKEILLDQLQKVEQAAAEREQRATLEGYAAEMQKYIAEGNITAAFEVVDKAVNIKSKTAEASFSKYLQTPTAQDIVAALKSKKEGIPTGYCFKGEGKDPVEWEIPTGALTYICAPTSHGKSRFLQNLALNMATGDGEGDILYISLEEDSTAVIERFINLYNNEDLNTTGRYNSSMIRKYYAAGDTQYIKADRLQHYKQSEAAVLNLLQEGRLRILSRSENTTLSYIEELMGAVEYISKHTKIKAVFIDYVQLIYSRSNKGGRKEELMEVCNSLMEISVNRTLPIVLAAQLNREATSPLDMSVQHIADASNIEHSANMVLLLWDSKVQPTAGKDNSYRYQQTTGTGESKVKEYKLTAEAQALEEKGFKCGVSGKIYCLLAKNRGGERNIDAILECNPNTGKVKSNKKAAAPVQAPEKKTYEDDGIPF